MRIVFLGTPDFAVASLRKIVDAGYNVVGVITTPDRLGGRGRKQIIETAVKKYALSQGIKVLQPPNLKAASFIEELESLKAHLQIVVAFRMLPVVVWDMPLLGTYNLHGSLLPAYRGAAPINWAVIKGEEYTGVTTFKLRHEIDTGSIAYQEKVPIYRNDNVGEVHDRMMEVGADLVVKTIKSIEKGNLTLTPQDDSKVSKAPKIFQADCKIDWSKDAFSIYNLIRGLSPYPVAWTPWGNGKLKIYRATYTFQKHNSQVGQVISDGKRFIAITCKEGLLFLQEIQASGRKRMSVKEFLNGSKFEYIESTRDSILNSKI